MHNPFRSIPRTLLAQAVVALFLSGCGLTQSVYQRTPLDVPERWNGASLPTTGSVVADGDTWWRRFDDPQLDALINRVLRRNNDLAAAALRLYRARLQAGLTDTNLTPTVSIEGSNASSRNLRHSGPTTRSATSTTSISYELDLWGHLARQRDVADFETHATEYDRRAAALSLVGQTVTAYWQIAYLKNVAATTEESIGTARRTLQFIRTQHIAGEVSNFEESQTLSTLRTLEGEMTQITTAIETQRNTLAILFDQSPEHRELELDGLPIRAMPAIPPVVPSDVLSRRPDLQAAEMRVRESLAQADVERLSFYPTFSLFTTVQSGGTRMGNILQNPIGTLGSTLALPFIQWNTMNLTNRSAKATFDEAVVSFRQTFYQALADTRSAWTACVQSDLEVRARRESVDAARRAESLAEIRYQAGDTSLTDWLNLQQTRQQADVQLQQAVYTQYVNTLTLFLALGGDPASQAVTALQ